LRIKIGILICLQSVCSLTPLAQAENSPKILHRKETSAIHAPPQEIPTSLKTIYSNLGKSKTDLYDDFELWYVSGPNSIFQTRNIALPFTPQSNFHVSPVQVAIRYLSGEANQVNLNIYGDASGVPGTLLAGPVTVTNLPTGGRCTLAIASFSSVAVTVDTQYWVVADTPPTGQRAILLEDGLGFLG
jgi:hypothetical protein